MGHVDHKGGVVAVSAVAALVLAACGSGTDDPAAQQTLDQETQTEHETATSSPTETHDDMG